MAAITSPSAQAIPLTAKTASIGAIAIGANNNNNGNGVGSNGFVTPAIFVTSTQLSAAATGAANDPATTAASGAGNSIGTTPGGTIVQTAITTVSQTGDIPTILPNSGAVAAAQVASSEAFSASWGLLTTVVLLAIIVGLAAFALTLWLRTGRTGQTETAKQLEK